MLITKITRNLANAAMKKPCFLFAEILLTYNCSQRCLQCNIPLREVEKRHIDVGDFRVIVNRLSAYGTQGLVLSGGEPTMHPRFETIMEDAARQGFMYKLLLSNLYFSQRRMRELTELLLRHKFNLTCSFDGLGETADIIRGGKNVSDIVMANMEYLDAENRRAGRPIKTLANIVISKLNLPQIPQMITRLEKLGWNISVDLYRNSSINHNQVDDMMISDWADLEEVMARVKESPNVVTPGWLLDGYKHYFNGGFEKQCPYISNLSLGSKFFVYPDGDVRVCMGEPIGNLLQQMPGEIFTSDIWQQRQQDFQECPGCWNTCYTPAAKISSYFKPSEIGKVFKMV